MRPCGEIWKDLHFLLKLVSLICCFIGEYFLIHSNTFFASYWFTIIHGYNYSFITLLTTLLIAKLFEVADLTDITLTIIALVKILVSVIFLISKGHDTFLSSKDSDDFGVPIVVLDTENNDFWPMVILFIAAIIMLAIDLILRTLRNLSDAVHVRRRAPGGAHQESAPIACSSRGVPLHTSRGGTTTHIYTVGARGYNTRYTRSSPRTTSFLQFRPRSAESSARRRLLQLRRIRRSRRRSSGSPGPIESHAPSCARGAAPLASSGVYTSASTAPAKIAYTIGDEGPEQPTAKLGDRRGKHKRVRMADEGAMQSSHHAEKEVDPDAVVSSKSILLKAAEVIISIFAIGLTVDPFDSFYHIFGHEHKPKLDDMAIIYVAVAGYVVINAIFIIGHLLGDRMPKRTAVLFSAVGTILHIVAGSMMVHIWRKLHGNYAYVYNNNIFASKQYSDMLISAAFFTFVNAAVFAADVVLTIKYF